MNDRVDDPGHDEVLFLPLGGVGEIGMNMYLYGHKDRWIMVDCGISFGDDYTPGIDILTADPSFIADRKGKLDGIIVTHAHEDHIGAIGYLWQELECPVYVSPFAAEVLDHKLAENDLDGDVKIHKVKPGKSFKVGAFEIEMISVSHSVPEANALAITTDVGTLIHTGDFKFDSDPLILPALDEARFKALGDKGVRALICDSTNALDEGSTGSEGDAKAGLLAQITELENRVAVTCFSTNVARLVGLLDIAAQTGRRPCLVGRSLVRMGSIAKKLGYLPKGIEFVDEEHVGLLPKNEVLIVCTGSQGEPMSALARISRQEHRHLTLDAGDAVIFSAREIPGNETKIGRVQNRLTGQGVQLITENDGMIHVSGHPAREDLKRLYDLVRPDILIPMHGETRHLLAHRDLALAHGIDQALYVRNGNAVGIVKDGPAKITAEIPSGRLGLDGDRLVEIDGSILRERRKISSVGHVTAVIVVNEKGEALADPIVSSLGVLDKAYEGDIASEAEDWAWDALDRVPNADRKSDKDIAEFVRRALRRFFMDETGKKPVIDVHVTRLKK